MFSSCLIASCLFVTVLVFNSIMSACLLYNMCNWVRLRVRQTSGNLTTPDLITLYCFWKWYVLLSKLQQQFTTYKLHFTTELVATSKTKKQKHLMVLRGVCCQLPFIYKSSLCTVLLCCCSSCSLVIVMVGPFYIVNRSEIVTFFTDVIYAKHVVWLTCHAARHVAVV